MPATESRRPIVRVIAVTQFRGVPPELIPEQGIREDQDQGSDAARLIECAGRACYDSYGAERSRSSADYHDHLLEVRHGSVLAHANLTFWISNVSRGMSEEHIRHHVGVAVSKRSTRFVDESETPWVWHPLLMDYLEESGDTRLGWEMETLQDRSRSLYRNIFAALSRWLPAARGLSPGEARKAARGAARGALGLALGCGYVWTVNVRALRNIVEERATDAADAEIRDLMLLCYEAAKAEAPEYFQDYTEAPARDGIGATLTTPNRKV